MSSSPLPRVIVHTAVSLDGRTTGFDGDIGLFYELAATWKEDASLNGSDTLIAAEAEWADSGDGGETRQKASESAPLLVVPDSRGRVKA